MLARAKTTKSTPSAKKPQENKPEEKEWTVLIYMVSDGPSGSRALDDIAQRELVDIISGANTRNEEGKTPLDDIYVAVQMDLKDRAGTLRYVLNRRHVEFDDFPERSATDPLTVISYFKWVHNECPARHYLVVFWGHSSSFIGLFGDSATPTAAPSSSLRTNSLARCIGLG